jgi:formylglycine-generating enzyme required for sulfatase activity
MATISEKKPRIFLSYRREDSRWPSGQIAQRLSSHFGKDQVIYDLDALAPGLDFHKQLEYEVKTCDYLIAVIGRLWLTACDDQTGRRRLDDPEDWVRREIELALSLGIPVIPLLLDDISMPSPDQLPEGLKDLPRRHAQSIHPHPHLDFDLQRLIEKIEQINKKRLEDEIQTEKDRIAKKAKDERDRLEKRAEDLAEHEKQLRESIKGIQERRIRLREVLAEEEVRLRDTLKRVQEEHQRSEIELTEEEHRLRESMNHLQKERTRLDADLGEKATREAEVVADPDSHGGASVGKTPKKNFVGTRRVGPFPGINAGEMRDDNSLKTRLVWIPAGDFTMGSPKDEEDRCDGEAQIQVSLTKGFWLGQHALTQAEWQRAMQTTPWTGKDSVKEGDDYPATYVSWDDATEFCEKLTETEWDGGCLPSDWKYTLPTEVQWEYACRAAATSRFSFGDDESDLVDYAWFAKNADAAGEEFAHLVGHKKANPWGLYDMHGNVWEWCRDIYMEKLTGGIDPEVATGGSVRVLRGGSWWSKAGNCRSARRNGHTPDYRFHDLGFRIAAVPFGK